MSATVAIVVAIGGLLVSLVTAISNAKKNARTVANENKALGLEQLRLALEVQDLQIKRLTQETKDQAKRIDALETEIFTLQSEREALLGRIEELETEVTALKTERDSLRDQLNTLRTGANE